MGLSPVSFGVVTIPEHSVCMNRRLVALLSTIALLVVPIPVATMASTPSSEYLLSDLKVAETNPDGNVAATTVTSIAGSAFESYETNYFYNISSFRFADLTISWNAPAGSAVSLKLQSGPYFRFPTAGANSVVLGKGLFCNGNQAGDGSCPSGSEAGFNVLSITVTSEDGNFDITYVINVVRPIAMDASNPESDFFNHSVWSSQQAGQDAGLPQGTISTKRRYVEVPGVNTMTKWESVLQGWRNKATNETYALGEYIYVTTDIELEAIWVLDALTGFVEVEDSEVNIDRSLESGSSVYGVFSDNSPEHINLNVVGGRTELALYSYPDNSLLDSIDTSLTARDFFILTGSNCQSPSNAGCTNVFKISVTAYSPSGNESTAIDSYFIRETSQATFDFDLVWSNDLTETSQVSQGWFDLPSTTPDGFTDDPLTQLASFLGSPFGPEIEFQRGAKVPVLGPQSFSAVIVQLDIRPTVNLFGHDLVFSDCQNLTGEYCLDFDGDTYEPNEDGSFFITVDIDADLTDPSDDTASQSFVVTWSNNIDGVPMSGSAQVMSEDFRWLDFLDNFADVEDLGGQMSDDFICPDGNCNEVWSLNLWNEEIEGAVFDYFVYFIINTDQETFDISFAPEELAQPTQTLANEPRGWIEFPPDNSYSKSDHRFFWWSSTNTAQDDIEMAKYPILQDDTIYAMWRELYQLRFFNGNQLVTSTEIWYPWELRDLEIADPVGQSEFLGWALEPDGSILASTYSIAIDTDFYAVWEPLPPSEPVPVPVSPPVSYRPPAEPPKVTDSSESSSEPILLPIETKTQTNITVANGMTAVEAIVPAKYVNGPARIEIRRVINGKVRYYLLGRAWTHFDRKRNDFSKAAMTFMFPLELKPDDAIRVKVRGIQVIRAKGDGTPNWPK